MVDPIPALARADGSSAAAAPAFVAGRAEHTGCDWTFGRLLGQVSVETFHRDYWGRHPLLIRGGGADFFASLITLAHVEELLAIPRVFDERMVSVRAKGESVSLAPSTVGDIYERMHQGASLQFRKMERFLPAQAPLRLLYRDMLLALQHPGVSISGFVTPPGTELLGAHHDETDVFTLQVAGRKRWRLFHTISAESGGSHPPEALGAPEHDFVLGPGDVLYHPRGCIHEVVCEDELSFSIPIVIEPVTWKTLLHQLIDRLGNRPEFLESLPSGTILEADGATRLADGMAMRTALIAAEAAKLQATTLIDAAATEFLRGLGAPAPTHVVHALNDGVITETTTLVTRHGDAWHVSVRDDDAILTLGGGDVLKGPGSIAPALRAIMRRREPIIAGELDASLSPPARLLLARKLVRLGALAPIGTFAND
jgi:ribosomal protein L16 Arg81 hydroxylase